MTWGAWRRPPLAILAGGGRAVQRATLKASRPVSRQVFNPRLLVRYQLGLEQPIESVETMKTHQKPDSGRSSGLSVVMLRRVNPQQRGQRQ